MQVHWIKMRDILPDEPEVAGMAEGLGLDIDTVLGKLFRFWVWADQHTVTGVIREHIGERFIDHLVRLPGFAAALESVGWLELHGDDKNSGFTIPRFTRHNGKSAKRRALDTARAQARRLSKCDAQNRLGSVLTSPSVSYSLSQGGKGGGDGGASGEVVEWFHLHLCMDLHTARATVEKLGTKREDLAGWQAALDAAEIEGLRDPRAYVRSRATRFRTAGEAGLLRAKPKTEIDRMLEIHHAAEQNGNGVD